MKTTTKVWLTPYSNTGPKQLLAGDLTGVSYNNLQMSDQGWTQVGTAEVTVTLFNEKDIINKKVEALKEEIKEAKALAVLTETRLQGQIQELLAITYEG